MQVKLLSGSLSCLLLQLNFCVGIFFSKPLTTENVRSAMPAGLLVIEAKQLHLGSTKYIPQVVGEMYTSAKSLRSVPPFLFVLYPITLT